MDSTPGAESTTRALNNAYAQYLAQHEGAGTPFTLDVHKTDGQSIEVAGAPGYRMFIDVTVELPNGFRAECTRPRAQLCYLYAGLPPMPGPATLTYRGSLDLSKTENSWRIMTFNIDFGAPTGKSVPTPPDAGTAASSNLM
ncbi:MAG: hypothetical protein WDN31_02445 [Hyphomicrobium sp.]